MPKRFVLWAAVSSLPQVEKVSLQSQIEQARQAASHHDGEIVAELVIPGESRDIVLWEDACRTIDAYARLRELIESRSFDVLVFLNPSRLGRTAALIMAVQELCRRAGIILYDLDAPPATLDSPQAGHADLLINAIKSVGAQQEVIELARRNAMGMVARVQKGEFPHAPPWGWVVRWEVDGEQPRMAVEVDPQAAAALRLIVDEYLNHGAGNEAIAEKLQAAGYPSPRGDKWWKTTIQRIVVRAWRYAGYNEINLHSRTGRPYVRAKSRWPAIITEAEAEALLAEQKRRVSARRSVGSLHRFSQCVWCADCNRRMNASWGKVTAKGRGYRTEYYFCRHGDHDWERVSARKIFAAVRSSIEFASLSENRTMLAGDIQPDTSHIEARIVECENRLRQTRASRNRADDAYVSSLMDEDGYRRQVKKLKRQAEAIQAERAELQAEIEQERHRSHRGDRLSEFAEQGAAMLKETDLPTAAAWFRARIHIWVSGSQVVAIEHI